MQPARQNSELGWLRRNVAMYGSRGTRLAAVEREDLKRPVPVYRRAAETEASTAALRPPQSRMAWTRSSGDGSSPSCSTSPSLPRTASAGAPPKTPQRPTPGRWTANAPSLSRIRGASSVPWRPSTVEATKPLLHQLQAPAPEQCSVEGEQAMAETWRAEQDAPRAARQSGRVPVAHRRQPADTRLPCLAQDSGGARRASEAL